MTRARTLDAALEARKADVKAGVSIPDVLELLTIDADPLTGGRGWVCDCPCCAEGRARVSADGRRFSCASCGASSDVIGFYQAARPAGFLQTIDDLHAALTTRGGRGDTETGSLF
ncbi:hypothetical protein [Euryhalocaulis caribicus]|uniref:hypothetical protein n=1 Tax=Euryhalocaulis caribicus TaxID=1161401 RepID=UPI0003A31E66|nr:hypothetical protein [Euryhalocaulis caribicus]